MITQKHIFVGLLFIFFACGESYDAKQAKIDDPSIVRIATYNIANFSVDALKKGDRVEKIKQVIADLDADIIGLQEIKDRAALELIFSPDEWQLVIDDESEDSHDPALAVKKKFTLMNVNEDLDADKHNFFFPELIDDLYFPGGRDVLTVRISPGDTTYAFYVLVHHATSRIRGRASTEKFRNAQAQLILGLASVKYGTMPYVLLGDFNDSPDDKSLNMIETGRKDAKFKKETDLGPYLANLTDYIYKDDYVSWGRTEEDIVDGRVNTINKGIRDRNYENRNQDVASGDNLFDQILLSADPYNYWYIRGSISVYDGAVAVIGNDTTRASDHLPVFADFRIQ